MIPFMRAETGLPFKPTRATLLSPAGQGDPRPTAVHFFLPLPAVPLVALFFLFSSRRVSPLGSVLLNLFIAVVYLHYAARLSGAART